MAKDEGPPEYERIAIVREVRERGEGDSGGGKDEAKFNVFVYTIFVAVVMFAGAVIWQLVTNNAALDKRVTVLEFKCPSPPVTRGAISAPPALMSHTGPPAP